MAIHSVSREDAVSLLEELGEPKASTFKDVKIAKRLAALERDENQEFSDERLATVYEGVLTAIESNDTIEVLNNVVAEKPEKKKGKKEAMASKPAKGKKDDAKKAAKGKSGNGKASKEAEKPEKKKGPKDPGRNPGVLDAIIACIAKASKKNPATKASVLEYLKVKFPDRDPTKMKATVGVQLPTKLAKSRGIEFSRTEDGGFYIPKG